MTAVARSKRERRQPSRPPVEFVRIQHQRAHEYVVEQIRRHIALRLVGPGESLPSERELATMFGVGRPTIQQALKLLGEDNLVESRRGRHGGTFVRADDAALMEELIERLLRDREELEELLVYRRTIEPAIARLAAEARRRSDLTTMRRAMQRMDDSIPEPEYMRLDTEFHLAVAAATRNRYLTSTIDDIRTRLNDVLTLLPESSTWHARIAAEHEEIFEAIAARDPDAAEEAADYHVASCEQGVRAVLTAIRRRRTGARSAR